MGGPRPAYRTLDDRQPAPVSPAEGTDQLDLTARQVRLGDRDDRTVHALAASWSDPWVGATYRTVCCHILTKSEGAVLTTREADCGRCLRGGS